MLPGPQRVAVFAWQECLTGALPAAFAATLARVVVAFVLAMLGGGILGYVTGRSARVNAWVDPWVVIGLNLPVLVVIVLAYIWVGLNDAAAILAVVLAKAPTVVVTVREGARALDPGLAEMAQAFDLPQWRRLRYVVLPQLLPYLAAAGRSGLSITWKIVLLVELLGRPSGVGYELNLFFQNFNVTGILATAGLRRADAAVRNRVPAAVRTARDGLAVQCLRSGSIARCTVEFGTERLCCRTSASRWRRRSRRLAGPVRGWQNSFADLLGLDNAFEGQVRHDIRRVGVVFQEPRLLPWLTVRKISDWSSPMNAAARYPGLLETVQLGHAGSLRPAQLSLGMARRARAGPSDGDFARSAGA